MSKRSKQTLHFNAWEILGFSLGFIACCFVAVAIDVWVNINRTQQTFEQHNHQVHARLTQRIASTDAVLNSLTDLHQASEELQPYEYKTFLAELLKHITQVHIPSA